MADPPKKNRERHLEKFNNEILINKIINNCIFDNINLYILIHKENINLKNHIIKYYKNKIKILETDKLEIYETFKKALSIEGKTILVCGDLINLKKEYLQKFIDSKYSSALCRYKIPWGKNIISNKLIRRSDIGDCISMFSDKDKQIFLSKENYNKTIEYIKMFYPSKIINYNIYNDIGTHLTYSFFINIYSNPNINEYEDQGTIYCDYKIYEDND